MKKMILLLTALALGASAYTQPISTTLVALHSKINSIVILHFDSTVNPTDTFWGVTEVSQSPSFIIPFMGAKIKRIGGRLYSDTVAKPLVQPGVQYWIRFKISSDSLMINNLKVSSIQTATPRYPIDSPTIAINAITPTTSGAEISYSWNNGYDSAKITRSIAVDSNFLFKYDTSWIETKTGTKSQTISGMQSGQNIYVRYLIQNSISTMTARAKTKTLSEPQKPWLREPIDSILITGSTIDIYGRGLGYGIPTFVQASSGTKNSSIDSLNGSDEESYHVQFLNLTPNTSYSNVTVIAQNSKGSVMFNLGTLRTLEYITPTVFTVVTDSAIRTSGTTNVRVYGHAHVPKNATAQIFVALFTDKSSSVSAYQKENPIIVNSGITKLDWTFNVDTLITANYGKFWGFDDKGGFDLDGTPVNVKVVKYQVFQTGVRGIVEKENFFIFPNPCNDVLTIPSYGKFEILDMSGKKIMDGFLNEWEKQISVSSITRGTYLIKIQNEDGIHTARFIKN